FELNAYSQVIEKKKAAQRLKEALAFFSEQGIDVMLAKGIALEQLVYDQPWFTVTQDIDLILRRRLEDISPEELHDIQSTMHNSGIEYDFYSHHDLNINGALPVDFDRIWGDAHTTTLYEQQVYLMTPEDLLISVCINSCRKRFFRLKSLCDIAETVRKFPTLDWEQLAEKAASYDCTPIIYTALQVTDCTLGCPVPDGVVRMLKVNPARKWLLDRTIKLPAEYVALASYPFSGVTLSGRQINLA
ncbi:MAG: nucleotidyltransferase family protein, partial [Anaerolineales bacterium]|nr:nucleotidyltransferase family protein [Anaerolineales bacterium]